MSQKNAEIARLDVRAGRVERVVCVPFVDALLIYITADGA